MDSTHWNELKSLFSAALDVSPEQRNTFLREACASNEGLLADAQSLLRAHDHADGYFESLAQKIFQEESDNVPDLLIEQGGVIAQYQVLEKLGSGGMGVVYKAFDTRLERLVALKFLPPSLAQDAAAKTQLTNEAKAASALNHPNIATIHEIGGTDNQLHIAMEYCEGKTLKSILRERQPSLEESIYMAQQIVAGLSKAHAKGIIHRDIKPANVIVDEEGGVKIIDFGLARTKTTKGTRGAIQGTIAYMSPEQLQGNAIDERSDIWSFGVILYETLSGKRPFPGESYRKIIDAILHKPPTPVSSLREDIPSALHALIHKALSKDIDARYQTIQHLSNDLRLIQQQWRSLQPIKARPGRQDEHSIAVLPFRDLSPGGDQEYFSDGITEEINDALARVKRWRVVARTSAFVFKGHRQDAQSIGRQLNVGYILEGSVRKAGSRVRVKAQLVSVKDGFMEWSEQYDREIEDVFSIQEDIARTIASKLPFNTDDTQPHTFVRQHTGNVEAYHLYLQARFLFNKRTPDSVQKGKALFEQAIALDASYAPAYAGLADCFVMLSFQGFTSPQDAMPLAKTAASQALQIDNTLAEAHTSMGCIHAIYDRDWTGATASFKQALSLNPSYAPAYHWYTIWCLLPTGQFKKGTDILKKAQELDPFSLIQNTAMGWHHYFARQYDDAIRVLKHTLEMEPSFFIAHEILGQVYLQKGWTEKAIPELQEAVRLSNRRTLSLASLGHAWAVAGRLDEAFTIADALERRAEQMYVSPFDLALIYTGLGEKELAFENLEKALEDCSGWLCFLNIEPRFDPLRSDARFTSILSAIDIHIS